VEEENPGAESTDEALVDPEVSQAPQEIAAEEEVSNADD